MPCLQIDLAIHGRVVLNNNVRFSLSLNVQVTCRIMSVNLHFILQRRIADNYTLPVDAPKKLIHGQLISMETGEFWRLQNRNRWNNCKHVIPSTDLAFRTPCNVCNPQTNFTFLVHLSGLWLQILRHDLRAIASVCWVSWRYAVRFPVKTVKVTDVSRSLAVAQRPRDASCH